MDWNNLSNYAIFGFTVSALLVAVFISSCIVSAIKAVMDRRLIKARNQARRSAQTNGDVSDSGRKHRPNILIIHDGEREARVKMGSGVPRSNLYPGLMLSSSPKPPGSGSRFSSPGEEEQTSRHTETTVVAEVACHRSSLCSSSNSPGMMGETPDGGGDVMTMTNIHRYQSDPRLKQRGSNDTPTRRDIGSNHNHNYNIHDNNNSPERRTVSVDFDGDAVAYKARTTPNRSSGRSLTKKKSRSLDCPYSSKKLRSGSRSPRNRRSHSSTAAEGRIGKGDFSDDTNYARELSPVKTTTVHHHGRYYYTIAASDGDLRRSGRCMSRDGDHNSREQRSASTTSSSFHGFTKKPNAGRPASSAWSSSSHTYTAASVAGRYMKGQPPCAAYSPKRTSYAVAVDNPCWEDTALVRRHSDEPQHRFSADYNPSVDSGNSSSTSHLYQRHFKNPTRLRHQEEQHRRKGAENPAYEAAGDSFGDNTDL